MTELNSDFDFRLTLDRLTQAIKAAGMTVFATIDHQEAANGVGMSIPPTTVLVYGNPRGGTPIMLQFPRAALDLPLTLLVREEPVGRVIVSFHPVMETLQRVGVSRELAASLLPAQSIIFGVIQPATKSMP